MEELWTTPRENKHKMKKIKLSVLKYYYLDENIKILLHHQCAAGIFNGHFDRYYCSKCDLTD